MTGLRRGLQDPDQEACPGSGPELGQDGRVKGVHARLPDVSARRLLMNAAAQVVMLNGAGVSLSVIAEYAAVSKSGLMHYFCSRRQLMFALAHDVTARFHLAVHAALDPCDRTRGRLLRAYVDVTFAALEEASGLPSRIGLLTALATVPGVPQLARDDARRWSRELAHDGLHPQQSLLVCRAADGVALSRSRREIDRPEVYRRIHDLLLDLTRSGAPRSGEDPAGYSASPRPLPRAVVGLGSSQSPPARLPEPRSTSAPCAQ
ncbi:TetR/AcrR family transcriptional regulator [Paenibacillus sp. TRM 82003]|uniref:TetR/AcrR family transcriptional regulator n=1 Tax=Kineococcus sp. TRM81007 TaxID=2925831 RepID=UPI001F59BCBE|nr:TetR family transcriptional regulator [Kineococcus sp. TRM81007]MCI2240437.1 TetR/AcrR family transcriptional regulator [Kineococcus sp. TRM81007]MCI3927387.1 TetR/AcrR family transcriptional regulator [Paenibacillus sp. TRM 82003]